MTFSLAANVGLKPGREQNIAGCELELLEASTEASELSSFAL